MPTTATKKSLPQHGANCSCAVQAAGGRKAIAVVPAIKESNTKRLRRVEGQVRGLQKMSGLSYNGNFDAPLAPYEGRKGRVSRNPPAWVIKAAAEPVISHAGGTATIATPIALVPVLLDSRSPDRDRGQGVWLAVPPENLKVLD